MPPPTSLSASRRRLPAWVLSGMTHLTGLFLLVLLWTNPGPTPTPELDRPVAIVLASTDQGEQLEYFSEADSAEEAESEAEVAPDTASMAAAALPAAMVADGLASDQFTLPVLDTGALAAEAGLLQSPKLTVSGSSRIPSGLDPSAIFAEEAARRRALAARGPEAQLGLFGGSAASGRSFVFLIDRSKSMGGAGLGAMAAAERELLDAVAALQPNHTFQVIAYHHQCVFLGNKRQMLPATDENKAMLRGYLSGLAAFGATEHMTGLMTALQLTPDAIFLLTDGGVPHLSLVEVGRVAKRAGGRTSIHCIQFGSGARQDENNFLDRLAASCRGGYGYVDMSQGKSE